MEEKTNSKLEKVLERPRKALERFPTVFLLLVTSGVVMVLFGFEKLFDRISFLNENPVVMIVVGVSILIFTGSLYKKLS